MTRGILCLLILITAQQLFAQDRLDFTVTVNGIPYEFNIGLTSSMPGDTLRIDLTESSSKIFSSEITEGDFLYDTPFKWRYIVPSKSGNYKLLIKEETSNNQFVLNVFVMTPVLDQKGEYLNKYRIGNYPQKAFRGNPNYLPPKGFIEVTEENKDIYVSPHFQLKQFLCKQQPEQWPKYLLLDQKILTKLELLIEDLNRKGLKADHLFIMSGYRTPYYNAAINNGKYSRHIYGDAVDVYVDENNDGVIDDLNKDGKAGMADADIIYQIVETIEKKPKYKYLIGGMGKYKKTATHTWDVHIDTRGYRARW